MSRDIELRSLSRSRSTGIPSPSSVGLLPLLAVRPETGKAKSAAAEAVLPTVALQWKPIRFVGVRSSLQINVFVQVLVSDLRHR